MITIHHIAIAAHDLEAITRFFDPVMAALGYAPKARGERFRSWVGPGPELLVYEASAPATHHHQLYDQGWHHVALQVPERDMVDRVHEAVVEAGGRVLDPPREYAQYWPGYFALFFLDPLGQKWEVMYSPPGSGH